MDETGTFTAEQFAERRHELPEGGRWTELVEGRLLRLEPPDDIHGNVVLNLSRALAGYFQERTDDTPGYACFELGLLVSRSPDTVRFPAACCYLEGEQFAEADKIYSDVSPAVVIEIASTNERRRNMQQRIEAWHAACVEEVWVIDTIEKIVYTFPRRGVAGEYSEEETVRGEPLLPGLELPVAGLFAPPEWWK